MTEKPPEEIVDEARQWWTTAIVDVKPGEIRMRGHAIEELIGTVSFAEMAWLLLCGDLPTRQQAFLFEAALVSSVDHGPHAPSIAIARMAVSCGAAINGATASAVNVLDDIHGGAGQQCMELFYEIDAAALEDGMQDAIACVIERTKRDGRYVPGFGHRFHPLDPRAPRLLALVDQAQAAGSISGRFANIARAVEDAISDGRSHRIPMNIDGATAMVYCELGLPPQLGRGAFILSRSVGIIAHAWEQYQQGGRIKGPQPKSIPYTYSGPAPRPVPPRYTGRQPT